MVFLFLLLLASVVLVGMRIPLSFLPGAEGLSLQVLIEYRGAFEGEVERIITIPLENALSEIRGVAEIFSLSEPGQSRIHLVLSEGSSLEDAYLETREKVDRLYKQLPPMVQRPLILRSDPRNDPVFIAAFPRKPSVSEENLKRRFQAVEGVGEVEVGGSTKEEIMVRWIPDRGLATGIVPFGIGGFIRGWNVSGGFGDQPELPLNLHHLISTPEMIGDVPIRTVLTVREVAEVKKRDVPLVRQARVNGEELLVLYVRPAGDENILRLSGRLTLLTRSIPGASILYDQGDRIRSCLAELFWSLGVGAATVVILTGVFLKAVVPSLLVSLSIPFSTFSALAVLHLLGKSLDVVSLSALTVGAGLVIDAGVILTDRFLQQKEGSLNKVRAEVRDPILLSSLTTMGVFFPLLFASPTVQIQFEPLAYTLIAQLGASLLYTLVFLPVFLASTCSVRDKVPIPRKPPIQIGRRMLSFRRLFRTLLSYTRVRSTFLSRSSAGLSESEEKNQVSDPSGIAESGILPLVTFRPPSFRFPYQILILLSFLFLLGTGIALLFHLPRGEERLRDPTQLDFLMEFESGVPLQQVVTLSEPLEKFLSACSGVDQVRVKYERERASFSLTLSELSTEELLQQIRRKASTIPHSFLFLPDSALGGSSISVVLSGEDTLSLQDTAVAFALYLKDTVDSLDSAGSTPPISPAHEPPGIVFHFKESLPSKRILLDPGRINRIGLSAAVIRDYLYISLSEPVIDKSITPDGEIDIRLTIPNQWIRDFRDIPDLPLPAPDSFLSGAGARLSDVSQMEEKRTPRKIYRTNRRRSASFTVLSDLKDPTPLVKALREASRNYPFPAAVTVEIGKEWEDRSKKLSQNLWLSGLSIFVLLLILMAFYGELVYPLLVIIQLPLFLSFSLLALWILQIPLTLSLSVGLLLTGGIGVNNALLVFPPRRKVIEAEGVGPLPRNLPFHPGNPITPLKRFRFSFRSMLTATLTTVAGILPLLFLGGTGKATASFQNEPFTGLSLVVGAGSLGSLLVLWGMVILLEPGKRKETGE